MSVAGHERRHSERRETSRHGRLIPLYSSWVVDVHSLCIATSCTIRFFTSVLLALICILAYRYIKMQQEVRLIFESG